MSLTKKMWVFRAVIDSPRGVSVLLVSACSFDAGWREVCKRLRADMVVLSFSRSVSVP
jgi:hypothetical protein